MEKKDNLQLPAPKIKATLQNCHYQEKFRAVFEEHNFYQWPWKIVKFCYGVLRAFIVLLYFLREPTDADVIGFIEWTVMGMLVTKHQCNGDIEYRLDVSNCRLKTFATPLENFSIVYTKSESGVPVIKSFTCNGRKTTNRQVMMSIVFLYQTTGHHTKCHLFANAVTEYIIDNKLTILYPSTRTSVPLHNGLLRSDLSSASTEVQMKSWAYKFVSHFYSSWTTRHSLEDESRNLEMMKGHSKRNVDQDLPYIHYLTESRQAVQQTLLDNNLPIGLKEGMFNHTIVHAVDHANMYSKSRYLRFGATLCDRNSTNFETFRCILFRWLMVKPTLNPLATNKIRHQLQSFYQRLYKRMKILDQKYNFNYADDITASVMY